MQKNTSLPATGERYVPELTGNIELEHMHRYIYALGYAKGKTVLDIASGEGYGAALLASQAAFVTGVDIAEDAVAHAQRKYHLPNLEFRLGSCSKVPLLDTTVDLVVSFETIEHHDEHEQMLAEIKRVLKPDGIVIISSPDKAIYTDKPDYHNPFHVKELYRDEFETLFRIHFKNVVGLGQKVMFGSGILPYDEGTLTTFTSVDLGSTESRPGLVEAMYNLIIASDAEIPAAVASFLDVGIEASETVKIWKAAVAQRDGDIERFQGQLAEQSARLTEQSAQLIEKNVMLAEQSTRLAEQSARHAEQCAQLVERHARLAEQSAQLVEKDARLAEQSAQLVEKDARLAEQSAQLVEKDARLAEQSAQLVEKDARLAEQSAQLVEKDARLAEQSPQLVEKDARLAEQSAQLVEKDARLAEQRNQLGEKGAQLAVQTAELVDRRAQVEEYLYHLNRINAWGWFRLGLFLDRLIRAPLRLLPKQRGNSTPDEGSNLKAKGSGPLPKQQVNSIPDEGSNLNAERSAALAVDLQFPTNKLSPNRDTVIVMVHEAERTGAPILGWNLAGELQKRYNVVVLLRRGGPVEQALRDTAAAVIRLADDFPPYGNAVRAVVDRLVKVYSPIYVIANSVETRYFVPDFEQVGVPVVALVHEFSSCFPPLGTLNPLFETASEIVFPARVVAEASLKDYRRLKARDLKMLAQGPTKMPPGEPPCGSSALAKTDVKGLWPLRGSESLLVIGVGTVNIRKGVDFFISAAALVRRAMPNRDVRFAWLGKCYSFDQPYMEYLKEQVERSGLVDAFAFTGEVEDVQSVYEQADILFLSSRLDPLPNVAIDAATNGIPVVCFDQASGMAEILAENADTQELVIPYLDAGAAACLICNLINDPERRARLSQSVRTVAEARFNMPRYVKAIDELGRNARTVLDQIKRDHALISKNNAFNSNLCLGTEAITQYTDGGLSRYLNASRLVAPRSRPFTGLFLRRPLEGFNPLIYASENPDYDEASGEDPLAHYIRTGRPDGRWTHTVLRPGTERAIERTSPRVAVHGHFHYPELLPDFIARLKRNVATVDLYLTTTSAAKAEELSKLIAASHFGRTKIAVVPNRGRDIGSMLTELGEAVLSDYDIIGHFHGKRSVHVDKQIGERWRNFLWEHLIGGEFAMLDTILGAFAKDGGIGLVFAEDPHLNDWDENRACADELAERMGLRLPLLNHFDFPIGTMFWARPAALKPLLDLKLTWDDYPEEPIPIDGTVLHALERLLPFSASEAGYRYATTYVQSQTR
jgi:glycosyltransferase involved in cell wall biosynthesis/SAM-dependent methyltransferase